jgi:hypothetical protein
MDEESNALASVFLASEWMDETRDYLARGRRFEKLSPDQLNDGWEGAFRRWLSRHGDPRETDDYAAELRLRELELPYERVENELKIIHDENAKLGPDNPGIQARIDKFMRSKANPQG